jgi:hypothetical protein
VGHSLRHDKLYLLSIKYSINIVSSENNVNVSSSKNKLKRIDNISLKLWHRHLGHISRGRIEHLVKESILPPLEFSDFEQCIDCIKGKYVKKIKKNTKRSTGILEIIHTDICGPFPAARSCTATGRTHTYLPSTCRRFCLVLLVEPAPVHWKEVSIDSSLSMRGPPLLHWPARTWRH